MSGNKIAGDEGEQIVVDLVHCPNCGKSLMKLPPNYPLFDVQCTGCAFRAQLKTNNTKPKPEIFGAGWEVMEKVLRWVIVFRPLIAHFWWKEGEIIHREILFYPFIPKVNLQKRQLSPNARRANYKMFNYMGLDTLPHFVLFKE